jgi:crystallin alpha B
MQFIQKYLIPEQCDPGKVTSTLSSDGVLMIIAPRKTKSTIDKREKIITIHRTGKPAVYKIQLHKFKLDK